MIKPDFSALNGNLSDSIQANQSGRCWKEFMLVISNLIEYCGHNLNEDEIAMFTKSLQDWITREKLVYYYTYESKKRVKGNVELGDIFYADLGINYKPEFSYGHPVVILEKVDNMVLVVPTTTSPETINEAYHPITNKTGKAYYRKVTKDDGFEDTCVLLLNNVKVISRGRLIDKKGKINENINDKDSIFNEVKNMIYKKYLPKQYIEYLKLVDRNKELEQNNNELIEQVNKLAGEIKALKETIENKPCK